MTGARSSRAAWRSCATSPARRCRSHRCGCAGRRARLPRGRTRRPRSRDGDRVTFQRRRAGLDRRHQRAPGSTSSTSRGSRPRSRTCSCGTTHGDAEGGGAVSASGGLGRRGPLARAQGTSGPDRLGTAGGRRHPRRRQASVPARRRPAEAGRGRPASAGRRLGSRMPGRGGFCSWPCGRTGCGSSCGRSASAPWPCSRCRRSSRRTAGPRGCRRGPRSRATRRPCSSTARRSPDRGAHAWGR